MTTERKYWIDSLAGFDFVAFAGLVEDSGGWDGFISDPDGMEILGKLRPYVSRLYKVRDFLKAYPIYGYLPNRAQDRFHYNPARGRGCFWANRTGKTVALVCEAYAHAIGYRYWLAPEDPMYEVTGVPKRNVGRIYVTTYDKWSQDVEEEWIRWVPSSEYEFKRNSARQVKKIVFHRTGSVIHIMTDDQKFKTSEGGKLNWAAFNEPIRKPHFTGTLRGLIDSNGPWWMNMTLIDTDRWIYDEIWEMADEDDEIEVIEGSIEDNLIENGGSLSALAVESFAKFLDDDERAARLEGTPTFATGRCFPTFKKEKPFIIPAFAPDPAWPTFSFIDPADRKPIAVLYVTVDPHAGYAFGRYEIYDGSLQTVEDVAEAMKEYEVTLPGGVALRWMDSSGKRLERTSGNNMIAAFAEHGIFCDPWPKADKVNTQIKSLRQWLKVRESGFPTFMITESCNRLGTFEMPKYHYGRDGKPVKVNDDLVDCAMAAAVVDVIRIARDLMHDAPAPDEHETVTSWGPSGGY